MKWVIWAQGEDDEACRWYAGGGRTRPMLTTDRAEAAGTDTPAPIVAALQAKLGDGAMIAAQPAQDRRRRYDTRPSDPIAPSSRHSPRVEATITRSCAKIPPSPSDQGDRMQEPTPSPTALTVGRFTLEPDGTLTGPAEYLASEAYRKCIAKIEAGDNAVVRFGATTGQSRASLLLVAIQTDYAAWRGMQQILAMGRR